jgi:hypothetical protein
MDKIIFKYCFDKSVPIEERSGLLKAMIGTEVDGKGPNGESFCVGKYIIGKVVKTEEVGDNDYRITVELNEQGKKDLEEAGIKEQIL